MDAVRVQVFGGGGIRGQRGFVIGEHGFNLLSLKSRPTKDLVWNYYFYVEGEGNINSEQGKEMGYIRWNK